MRQEELVDIMRNRSSMTYKEIAEIYWPDATPCEFRSHINTVTITMQKLRRSGLVEVDHTEPSRSGQARKSWRLVQ